MAENKLNVPNQLHDDWWETVADVIDQLQVFVDEVDSSKALVQKLLEADKLPGIQKQELSIVYCEYGTKNYQPIVYEGEAVEGKTAAMAFAADNPYIKDVIHTGIEPSNYPWFKTGDDCEKAGFSGFKTVLIIPMRLGRNRRLGAFIIHSTEEEGAYSERLKRILDVLSDRLAALIRSLRRRLRDKLSNEVRNKLLQRLASSTQPFGSEREILEELLVHLTNDWYEYDKIHLLIKNPLDINAYYLATNDQGNIIENFRTNPVLDEKRLYAIVGGEDNLQDMTTTAIDDLSGKSVAWQGAVRLPADLPDVTADCRSWLGVTMHHPDGYVFGHIVLHDTQVEHAYDDDDVRFMDAIADFTGFLLATFRAKQKEAVIQQLSVQELADKQQLCSTVADYLHLFYGVESFQILAIDSASQAWDVLWSTGASGQPLDSDFQNAVTADANEHRCMPKHGSPPLTLSYRNKNYLVTPMRTGNADEDWKVVGAFAIPTNNPGKIASRVIDEVSDALGKRLRGLDRQRRYEALTAFVNRVSSLPAANLTHQRVLDIAREHIIKVMFSENLYIALYDAAEDAISFPLIYQDGKVWETMLNQTRKIDRSQLGRTESIILDKKPLLIKTKAESEAWYAQPNHKEHAGNPLASWIGVPILSPDGCGVRGVIAAYHAELDYVYSVRDVFFLQNVAGAVAGLFRVLENRELEESNRKLEESNRKLEEAIANNSDLKESNRKLEEAKQNLEEAADTFSELQDKIRLLSLKEFGKSFDTVDIAVMAIENSINATQKAIKFNNVDILISRSAVRSQENAKKSLLEFKDGLDQLYLKSEGKPENLNFGDLIKRALSDLILSVSEKDVSFEVQESSGSIDIFAKEQDIVFLLCALFDGLAKMANAGDKILLNFSMLTNERYHEVYIKLAKSHEPYIIDDVLKNKSILSARQFLRRTINGDIEITSDEHLLCLKLIIPLSRNKVSLLVLIDNIEMREFIINRFEESFPESNPFIFLHDEVDEYDYIFITDEGCESCLNKSENIVTISSSSSNIYDSKTKVLLKDRLLREGVDYFKKLIES